MSNIENITAMFIVVISCLFTCELRSSVIVINILATVLVFNKALAQISEAFLWLYIPITG